MTPLLSMGCGNCHKCNTPVEGYDSTRASMDGQFKAACDKFSCSNEERAVIWAMAMQESDKMDKTDTSKGTTGGSSNWSPWNMNMDELGHLGCNSACAQSLGQYDGRYDINKAVGFLLKGLRGQTSIGG